MFYNASLNIVIFSDLTYKLNRMEEDIKNRINELS